MASFGFFGIPTNLGWSLDHNYAQFFIMRLIANIGLMVTFNCPLLPDYV